MASVGYKKVGKKARRGRGGKGTHIPRAGRDHKGHSKGKKSKAERRDAVRRKRAIQQMREMELGP